jgi:hypothetical protein
MDYPTMDQVEQADREQIYRWFLNLPAPRLIRVGKGQGAYWAWFPSREARMVMEKVYKKWLTLGGHDDFLSDLILGEHIIPRGVIKIDKGTE